MNETTPKRSGKHSSTLRTPCIYTIKIELQPNEIQPIIWRRLDVDGRISLAKLHHFIQAAFGWTDAHLHEYDIHDSLYRVPHPEDDYDDFDGIETKDERKAFLNRLLVKEDVFTYTYDFGDNWEHVITVENFTANDKSDLDGGAYVTDGARACPPEDVGGADGYHDFLEAILVDPKSEQAQEMRDWAGGNFDPQHFDKRQANAAIFRMMYNGWGGK